MQFTLSQKMSWFLWGHEAAFQYFGGVPRVILYDNLKSAVIRRRGQTIDLNKTLCDFSIHHGYEPRPVGPYRGNEKGKVERAVRYARDSLFAGLRWSSLSELNEMFPNSGCVVTMIDRLIHNAEIVRIDGESYRLKEAKEKQKAGAARRKKKGKKGNARTATQKK